MRRLRRAARRRAARFRRGRGGGTTALALFMLALTAGLAGLAVDTANLYRTRTMLQGAADAAAQAGVLALARGGDAGAALAAARRLVEANLPARRHGALIADAGIDLQLVVYDPATGTAAAPAPGADAAAANAVLVRLQRSEAAGNPLPTHLLGLFGLEALSLSAHSVAALVPTRRCGNAEGVVARGAVDLGEAPRLAAGFCLHSQRAIRLGPEADTAADLRLSLPDPRHCTGCGPGNGPGNGSGDGSGDGRRPAALNLLLPDPAAAVARLAAGFADPATRLPEEAAFFADRPLAGDPEALREVGLLAAADGLAPGQVLRMGALQFSQLRQRPEGLVYDVRCDTRPDDPRPPWQRTLTLVGGSGQPTLRNLVLVTDCAIEMDDWVRIEGTLILLTGPGPAAIAGLPGARLGDPAGGCDPARRTRVMATGDLELPAHLADGNLSLLAGGSLRLAAAEDGGVARHRGLVVQAGGAVTAAGRHAFARCPDGEDPLLLPLVRVALVAPPVGHLLPAIRRPVAAGMPGRRAGRLPLSGGARPDS
jgi:Flp pilus assembly protein TadG